MEIIVIIILSILNLVLIYLIFTNKKEKVKVNKQKKQKKRICPLCGSILTQPDDCLYGEYFEADGKKKVYIYGCNYCYKGKKHKRVQL